MFLSIIVPAFNEEDFIVGCLDSVRDVLGATDVKYEIIVVNNGSTDGTTGLLSEMNDVTTLSIDRASVAKARNTGAEVAKGRVIAFLDADVVLERAWGKCIEKLSGGSEGLFVTGYQYGVRDNPSWIEKYWFGDMEFDHISGGNLIVSRDAFSVLGGFDSTLKTGEDVDFCDRAKREQNIEFFTDSEFQCIHLGYPRNIPQFVKRELWHGEGDFRSISDFLKSKVAIVAMIYGLLSCLGVGGLIIGEWLLSAITFLVIVALNYVISGVRFGDWGGRACLFKNLINYIYFLSRFFSFFKAIKNRHLSY
ncbi:MAG: glycosyltransferase [Candidatus Aminicenantes bacterium]|nr:glycosyltransferase [Candidatus Aminicenantes bacterium]